MGVLRGASEAGHLGGIDQGFEFGADFNPGVAECLARAAEDALCQFGAAEGAEFDQRRLFVRLGRAVLPLDQAEQADRREIILRAAFPAGRKAAIAHEAEIVGNRRRMGRRTPLPFPF